MLVTAHLYYLNILDVLYYLNILDVHQAAVRLFAMMVGLVNENMLPPCDDSTL